MTWQDGLNIAATLATVGAAVLALLTIRDSRKQARRSAEALVRERRIDFELDVLKELADLTRSGSNVAQVVTRLNMLPTDLIPSLRTRWGLNPPLDAEARREEWTRQAGPAGDWAGIAMNDAQDEINEAIRERLTERAS